MLKTPRLPIPDLHTAILGRGRNSLSIGGKRHSTHFRSDEREKIAFLSGSRLPATNAALTMRYGDRSVRA
jgi:hypothetical protein